MGVRLPQNERIALPFDREIVAIPAFPGQQARILLAADRLADAVPARAPLALMSAAIDSASLTRFLQAQPSLALLRWPSGNSLPTNRATTGPLASARASPSLPGGIDNRIHPDNNV
jgi:hypothetical protein